MKQGEARKSLEVPKWSLVDKMHTDSSGAMVVLYGILPIRWSV